MAYESTVWLGTVAALCPSQDSVGDGTTTVTDFALVSNGVCTNMAVIANNWVTDGGSRALYFDGVNDHVVTGNCPSHRSNAMTLSFWFRRTGVGVRGPGIAIANSLTSVGTWTVYLYEDGKLYVQYASGIHASVTCNDASWHHVLVSHDGTGAANSDRCKVWIDGVSKTLTFFGTVPVLVATADGATLPKLYLGLGIQSASYYGAGYQDDIRVMGRVATSDERTALAASRGGTYTAASGGVIVIEDD